jgi:hypothetical protein
MVKKLRFVESKPDPVRLDLGAGKGLQTPDGFIKVDKIPGKGIKVVDLTKRWPWKANSVEEVHCAMLLQYLTPSERVHFFNELYRVIKPGQIDENGQQRGRVRIITPMWSAQKAYVDIGVQWPPVSEGFFHTLSKGWRNGQNCADVSGFTCNFDAVMGYNIHPAVAVRNEEFQREAASWSKEAAQDLIATLTKV